MYLRLNDLHGSNLKNALDSIRGDETSLDLNNNDLNYRSVEELTKIVKAFPISLKTLNLSSNYLRGVHISVLKESFSFSTCSLNTLDLSINKLGFMKATELKDFLSAFNPLTELNLAWNDLNNLKENLSLSLSLLSFQKINLRGNNLHTLSKDALIQIFTALPRDLQFMDLRDNELETKYNATALAEILSHLPTNTEIILNSTSHSSTFFKAATKPEDSQTTSSYGLSISQ